MTMTHQELTVGIPFHEGVDPIQLAEAIESILNQTFGAASCHLIQNGSVSPEVSELVESYVREHSHVELIYVSKKGLAAALNQSINKSTTQFYARMDSDDIALPDRFEKQIHYLTEHPEVLVLGGWAKEFNSTSGVEAAVLKKVPTEPHVMHEWFHYRNPFIHPTIMFRTRLFETLGTYDETYLTDQDLQLWGRVINANVPIANIPEVLIYFRTDNVISRRSQLAAVRRQAVARYSVKAGSLKLKILKIAALSFRLMPNFIQSLGYRHLR